MTAERVSELQSDDIREQNRSGGPTPMRYRRLSYRYTMVMHSGQTWPLGDLWPSDRLQLLVQGRWQPAADVYETATSVEIIVALAGVDDDDVEVQLFEDVVVIEGRRDLPRGPDGAVYHAARIRQGPFQTAVPLPSSVDPDRVEARFDRGLLRVTLAKRGERR